MILFWNKLGWVAPLVGLLGMTAIQFIVNLIFGINFYRDNTPYQNIAIAFSGGLVFIVGKYLNRSDKIEIRCKQTKQLLEAKGKHTFFIFLLNGVH